MFDSIIYVDVFESILQVLTWKKQYKYIENDVVINQNTYLTVVQCSNTTQ